ncbi:MAG: hypothetical protein QM817_11750 [Archangium sp.]
MKTTGVLAGVGLGAGLPIALFLTLNFMRPDLMQPMLDHVYGYTLIGAESLLWLIASALYAVAFSAEFKSRVSQIILIVCAVLFCTIPSLLGILFGPVVFAFLYGNVS